MQKLLSFFLIWRNLFSFVLYMTHKEIIDKDMARYDGETPFEKIGFLRLNFLLLFIKPFRSVFYYRLKDIRIIPRLNHIFIKPIPAIELDGKIGPGLKVFHNMGCVIYPDTIGSNCSIGHMVTIGEGKKNAEGRANPIIGDNVWISTGAIIFGGITVGNNVQVGAGCILNKDVPDNCTVVGNPARIIRH